jgi:hypothetical protein
VKIKISIKEVAEPRADGVESVETDVFDATIPPKLAAATLRAYADELDPPKPVMRGGA